MKTLLMSSAAALLIAGTAFAASMDAASMDANGDGSISRDEFNASMGDNSFGAWDTDNDGMLSRAEYEAGAKQSENADSLSTWDDRYSDWDENQDEMLTSDEYNQGLWTQYDANQDDMWDEPRFGGVPGGRSAVRRYPLGSRSQPVILWHWSFAR